MTTLKHRMNELRTTRRHKVEVRAKQLIGEEMTRQELRRARKRTQAEIARALHMSQDGVSRIERRADLLYSTLQKYVNALGGKLSLMVEFPDGRPVKLSGIAHDPNCRGEHQRAVPRAA